MSIAQPKHRFMPFRSEAQAAAVAERPPGEALLQSTSPWTKAATARSVVGHGHSSVTRADCFS